MRLSERSLKEAVDHLCEKEKYFAKVVSTYGYPPMWDRPSDFQTLVHLVLEQQVSLASAQACLDKLIALISHLRPKEFLLLSDEALRECGFSRQKMTYCRGIAEQLLENKDFLSDLEELTDEEVRSRLMALKGIGIWTANVYLLMVL